MPKFLYSIRFRIYALSIGLVLFISVVFLVIFLKSSRNANFEHLEDIAKRTMQYLNADIQNALAPAIDMANNIAAFASYYNHEQNNRLLDKIAKTDPSILDAYYGTALTRYEGGFFASGTNWNPYEEEPDWNHVKRPWFISAMQNPGKITITDPYEDSETHKICVTIVKTASDSIGKINGVVGIDVLLDKLTEIVNARKITEDGKSFLIDANGLYIIHQDTSKVMKDNILQDLNLDKSILEKQSIEFIDNMYVAVIAVPNTPNWYLMSIGSLKNLDKMDLRSILIVIAISIIVAIIVSFVLGNRINTEIKVVVKVIKQVSGGDLTKRLEIKSHDEIGEMSEGFNSFLYLLQKFLKKIGDDASNFIKSSQHLTETSHSLALGSEQTVSESNSIANTSEQMAMNIKTMADAAKQVSTEANEVTGAAEQMSSNINTIASAIEEMSASISQIAENADEAHKITKDATSKSGDATKVMDKLGISAKEIGHVTDVIKRIADKTNLLALNATIEAASAGAAGKGFAVVAEEIKELANQSAKNADDIARKIESIQFDTNEAVKVINDVSGIISKINHSVESISLHVGEQTRAGNEIANRVSQVHTGAKRVASSIGEVAKNSSDIARNAGEAAKGTDMVNQGMSKITQEAENSAYGAKQTNQQADVLAMIANDLKDVLNQFKV